jgi:hypothetical protein
MMLAREQPIGQWQEARAAPDEAAEIGPVPESFGGQTASFIFTCRPYDFRTACSSFERLSYVGSTSSCVADQTRTSLWRSAF